PCASSRLKACGDAGVRVRAVRYRRDPSVRAHSIPGSLPRRALQVAGSTTFCASDRLRWLRDAPRLAIQRCWRSERPASIVRSSIVRSGLEPWRAGTPLFRVAIHKIDYRALLAEKRAVPHPGAVAGKRVRTSPVGSQELRGSGAHARAWITESAAGVECAKADAGQWNRRPSDSVNTHPL